MSLGALIFILVSADEWNNLLQLFWYVVLPLCPCCSFEWSGCPCILLWAKEHEALVMDAKEHEALVIVANEHETLNNHNNSNITNNDNEILIKLEPLVYTRARCTVQRRRKKAEEKG